MAEASTREPFGNFVQPAAPYGRAGKNSENYHPFTRTAKQITQRGLATGCDSQLRKLMNLATKAGEQSVANTQVKIFNDLHVIGGNNNAPIA